MPRGKSKKTTMQLLDGDIKRLREEGYTLQQIGEKGGVTKEWIRQILKQYYPGTKSKVLSESQTAKILGVSITKIIHLRRKGLIRPEKTNKNYRYDEKTIEEVKKTLYKPCRICGNPIPPRNTTLCAVCSEKSRNSKSKLSLPGEREKYNKRIIQWNKIHKERSKAIVKKASTKYRNKLSKRNLELSTYEVKSEYPNFVAGEKFKAIGFINNKFLLADGRTIPTFKIIKVSGPKRNFSAVVASSI